MRQTIPLPPLAELQKILRYDPETGLLHWTCNRRGRVWEGEVAGSKCGAYTAVKTPMGRFYAHRIAWRFIHGDISETIPGPDHRDRNGRNNAASNLRPATEQQQAFNRRPRPSKSGYRGVTWQKRYGTWRARAVIAGKYFWLGSYDDPAEAGAAVQQFIRDNHGEFALPADVR